MKNLLIVISMFCTIMSLTGCEDQALELEKAVNSVSYYYQPDYGHNLSNVTYSAVSVPAWAKVNTKTGAIFGNPNKNGSSPVTISAELMGNKVLFKGTIFVSDQLKTEKSQHISNNTLEHNDLQGELEAEVNFIQPFTQFKNSHNIHSIKILKEKHQLNISPHQATTLLLSPKINIEANEVIVDLFIQDKFVKTLQLKKYSNSNNWYKNASKHPLNTWHVTIPAQFITRGLSLKFTSTHENKILIGDLASDKIFMSSSTTLSLSNVSLNNNFGQQLPSISFATAVDNSNLNKLFQLNFSNEINAV